MTNFYVVDLEGVEPSAFRMQNGRSSAELQALANQGKRKCSKQSRSSFRFFKPRMSSRILDLQLNLVKLGASELSYKALKIKIYGYWKFYGFEEE